MNQKIFFRVFLALLVLTFIGVIYSVFFSSSESGGFIENALKSVGFDSADGSDESSAVPLPSSYGGFGGGSSGGSSGSGGSGGGAGGPGGVTGSSSGGSNSSAPLSFCTFDLNHAVNGVVPCRCGLSATCSEVGQICDATFNNGQGVCV